VIIYLDPRLLLGSSELLFTSTNPRLQPTHRPPIGKADGPLSKCLFLHPIRI